MIRSGDTVYQASHNLLCQSLSQVLMDCMQARRAVAGAMESVQFRASVTLYALLLAHPLD
ncbi:MAG: hypothetical protein WCC38_06805 [Pseudonocardiaceae bacterium]